MLEAPAFLHERENQNRDTLRCLKHNGSRQTPGLWILCLVEDPEVPMGSDNTSNILLRLARWLNEIIGNLS